MSGYAVLAVDPRVALLVVLWPSKSRTPFLSHETSRLANGWWDCTCMPFLGGEECWHLTETMKLWREGARSPAISRRTGGRGP